jgi:hypothetical protein
LTGELVSFDLRQARRNVMGHDGKIHREPPRIQIPERNDCCHGSLLAVSSLIHQLTRCECCNARLKNSGIKWMRVN